MADGYCPRLLRLEAQVREVPEDSFPSLEEGFAAMPRRDDADDVHEAKSSDVAVCARTLNHTIGELARRYGTASVVTALTEVMGCASCATASVERGTSIRILVERLGVTR
jgi:hypothetical protein